MGKEMISFCPWGKSAIESEANLKAWMQAWLPSDTIFLQPEDWYLRGQDILEGADGGRLCWPNIATGTYVWYPPPAAADVCLEELHKARIKRKDSFHIIVVAKLFSPMWLRQLNKVADCHVLIPATHHFWGPNNFESLIIAFVFPFLPFRPWQLKGTPKMFSMGRQLCKMFKDEELDHGNLLLQFLLVCRRLPTLSPHVVWQMLYLGGKLPFPRFVPGDPWRPCQGRKRGPQGSGEIGANLDRQTAKRPRLSRSKRRRSPSRPL